MSRATGRDTDLLRFYDNEGIKLVRLSHRTKKPVDDEWQARTLPLEDIEEWVRGGGDIGWQCGEVSGWVSAVDLDCSEARRLAPKFLPETLRGAKGEEAPSQYFYRSPGLGYKKFSELGGPGEIIALKASNNGRGHQVAVAPSIHREKGPYLFVGGYNPAAIAVVSKDELRKRVGMLATAALIAQQLPPSKDEGGGGRHDLALALAGYMLRNGEAAEDVEKMLVGAWAVREAPRGALEDVRRGIRDTAARLARNEPATGGRRLEELIPGMPQKIADFLGWERSDMREQRQSYWLTDLGNAERFIDTYRDVVLWCPARRVWLLWDGTRWAWDERGAVRKLAHKVARSIYKDAAHELDEAKQREIAKFARTSQNESRIGAMLNEAKPYLAVGMDELDQDPWLINCQNGTLELRTGKLRAHDPADRITKIVPVDYEPDASCPRFKQFLKETLVEEAVISFVKRYSGYTLTGITRERLLAILYGFGKNGKTTLVELLRDVLGDYATNTDTETLLMRKYQGVGNDVAALKGARFVSAAEVEQGRRLAESKVKQLTGRDTVTARFLFGEPFNFTPEFKLWLSTNNKPVIQGTDDAIWDRIRLIPFTQRFDGARQDPKLPEKLRGELAGVLAWMVEGCLEWQEHGLGEPETVREATDQYRTEMDTLAAFLDEECVISPGCKVLAERLYQSYATWCDKSGERKEPKKAFVARLEERGFKRRRETAGVNKGRYIWLGIGFRGGDEPPEDGDDGSPSEPKDAHGSPGESRKDKPNSSGLGDSGEPSEAENQESPTQKPREEEDSDSEFTGFTGFTPYRDLTIEDVLHEFRKQDSGPAKTLAAYYEIPSEELRAFVQRAVGCSATGDTSEQCMIINHSGGANGKSTFQEAIAAALGDYAMRAPTEMLLAKRTAGVPNDVARLKGARFVAASETEEGRRLAESLVKDLTGQDTITARFMRAEWFDFAPTHKLWLSTNHKPEIRGTDTAIWRRIRLVPWTVTIPPAQQDKKLPAKLRDELPGILAWIVRGCLEWQREGLRPPDEVRRATGRYRAEMDVLAAFIDEECIVAEHATATAKALYSAYKAWCDKNGEKPETQRRFGGRLKERGFENGKITSGAHKGHIEWYGIGLAGGPSGLSGGERTEKGPPSESAANRRQIDTAVEDGGQSGPESTISTRKNTSRGEIPKKGPLHPLHPPESILEKCAHGFDCGRGCYLCDPQHPYRTGAA